MSVFSEPSVTRTHRVLAAYPRLILRLVKHWSITADDLLAETGLEPSQLDDPLARVPLDSMLRLIERARRLTGEPALGWYAGLQSRVSMYGFLGFGLLSAATLREAVELLVQFNPILGTVLGFRLELEAHGARAFLVIEENADLGPSRDFVLGGVVVAIWHLSFRLSGAPPSGSVDLMIPKPDYFPRISQLLARLGSDPGVSPSLVWPCPPVRFQQVRNRIVFERAKLDLPLIMADEAANRLAREQCEQALAACAMSIIDRIRQRTTRGAYPPSLRTVAAELRLSTRSLRRRLAEEGVTFSALVESSRRDKALRLLRTGLPVAAVSDELGYSSPANFIRAFRSWTRESPASYLQRHRGPRGIRG